MLWEHISEEEYVHSYSNMHNWQKCKPIGKNVNLEFTVSHFT